MHGDVLKKYKGNKIMKGFIGNETEKTTITFPDVSSFASNADSDTDDNQNPGCIPPLDDDGGNEAQPPMNFEECRGHDPEIIIHENSDSDPIFNYSGNTCKLGCVRPSEGISHASPTRIRLKESTRPQERDER